MFKDYNLFDKLLKEVELDNVFMSQVGDYALFKYTNPCLIYQRWNEYNREARGIVFHVPTKSVVCRPFSKFFNMDEREETKLENLPTSEFFLTEKLDGSCVSTYLGNHRIKCATPGSLISTQSVWAEEWLNKHLQKVQDEELKGMHVNDMGHLAVGAFTRDIKDLTFIFEAIYPENLNVVLYKGREELVLLTIRQMNGLELRPHMVDEYAARYKFSRPRSFKFDLSRTLAFPENEEGYVAYWPKENLRVKIKSPEYVRLHRIKSSFNAKGICEVLAESRFGEFLQILPPHLQKEADDIAALLRTQFYDLKIKTEDIFYKVRDLPTRKEQALAIQKTPDQRLWSLVFNMLDGHYNDRLLWRKIYEEL